MGQRQSLPGGVTGALIPAFIGAISAMMGIGGGTLSVPTMTLCGEPVHKAVGTAALLLMLPLAATSFNRAIKALGAARWQALHRSVYAVALLALLHFFWMRAGKNDFAEWSVYAVLVAALLGWRVHRRWLRATPTRA